MQRTGLFRLPDYLNGLEILGTPKTVRLEGMVGGQLRSGPMEVWVAALVATLDADQRVTFGTIFENYMRQRDEQGSKIARVVADIPMPTLRS